MSVKAGRTRLLAMMKDLQIKWDATKTSWHDPVSRDIEKHSIAPLERNVRAAVAAMEQMESQLAQARRECE